MHNQFIMEYEIEPIHGIWNLSWNMECGLSLSLFVVITY